MLEKRSITLSIIRDPFNPHDRILQEVDYKPGATLRHYLEGIHTVPGAVIHVAVNGNLVDNWDIYVPEPGSYISISAELEAGAAATAVVSAIGISGTIAGAIVYAITYVAVSMALSYAINYALSLLRDSPEPSGGIDDTRTYGWGALSPTQGEGRPIPILFGEHRVSGHILNQYTQVDGEGESAKEYLYVLLAVCEGTVTEISHIRANKQPISNFRGVKTYTRNGTLDDDEIPGFDKAVTHHNLTYTLRNGESYSFKTTGTEVEEIGFTVIAPEGICKVDTDGNYTERTVQFEVDIQDESDGTITSYGPYEMTGDSNTTNRRSESITGLNPGQYTIFIRRITEDHDEEPRIRDTIQWTSVREIINEAFIYPWVAKYAVEVMATDQLSRSQPDFTALVRREEVSVYDPNQDLWVIKSARNPAWATYSLLVEHHGMETEKIIWDEWEEWAAFCDTLPDSEASGGFGVSIYLDNMSNMWDQAQRVANLGRATIIRRGTKFGVYVNKQEQVVSHMFTMGNIIRESFKLDYLGAGERSDAIDITYVDSDLDFRTKTVTVYSSDVLQPDVNTNIKKDDIRVNAAMTRNRALQTAVYQLKCNLWLYRTIEFDAAVDTFTCKVGDLIFFQHQAPHYQSAYGGRIVTGNFDVVEIDTPIYLDSSKSYTMLLRFSDDDTIEERDVGSITESGYYEQIYLLSNFTKYPEENDLYLIGESELATKKYKIISIERNTGEQTATLSCIEYFDEVFQEGDVFIPEEPVLVQQEALNVSANEILVYSNDGNIVSAVNVSWQPAAPFQNGNWVVFLQDVTNVEIVDGSPTEDVYTEKIAETTNVSYQISPNEISKDREYRIIVVPIEYGPVDTGDNITIIEILGKEMSPTNVSGLSANWNISKRNVELSWNEIPDIDLSHYEIRKVPTTQTQQFWDATDVVIEHAQGSSDVDSIEEGTQGEYKYLIKAVDTSGNYSDVADTTTIFISTDPGSNNLPQVEGLELTSNCFIDDDGNTIAQLVASWSDSVEQFEGFDHYRILLKDYTVPGPETLYNGSFHETEENSYTWNLSPNSEYGVQVRAIASAETRQLKGPWSGETQIVTCVDQSIPEDPEIFKLVPGFKVMSIHWQPIDEWGDATVASNDLDYYEVERSSTGEFNEEEVQVGTTSSTWTTDSDLEVEKKYYYRVRAWDRAGNHSGWSDVASATTLKIGSQDIAYNSVTAEHIYADYLSAIAAEMGVVKAGYLISENWLENGYEIVVEQDETGQDHEVLQYTGDQNWDSLREVLGGWQGSMIDMNAGWAAFCSVNNDDFVLIDDRGLHVKGVINTWNSANDRTKMDGGEIHASSFILIGNYPPPDHYCYIDKGDIEFWRYFPNVGGGTHRKVKSLKRVEVGTAKNRETKELPGYWISKPRVVVWPETTPTYLNFYQGKQMMDCYVDNITYNSNTGVASFVPVMEIRGTDPESDTEISIPKTSMVSLFYRETQYGVNDGMGTFNLNKIERINSFRLVGVHDTDSTHPENVSLNEDDDESTINDTDVVWMCGQDSVGGYAFSDEGTKLFILLSRTFDNVTEEYHRAQLAHFLLVEPWNIGAGFDPEWPYIDYSILFDEFFQNADLSNTMQISSDWNICDGAYRLIFAPDGSKFYVYVGNKHGDYNWAQIKLNTPWDLSTAEYECFWNEVDALNKPIDDMVLEDWRWSPDGWSFLSMWKRRSMTSDIVAFWEYRIPSSDQMDQNKFDLRKLNTDPTYYPAMTGVEQPRRMTISSDGLKMIIGNNYENNYREYALVYPFSFQGDIKYEYRTEGYSRVMTGETSSATGNVTAIPNEIINQNDHFLHTPVTWGPPGLTFLKWEFEGEGADGSCRWTEPIEVPPGLTQIDVSWEFDLSMIHDAESELIMIASWWELLIFTLIMITVPLIFELDRIWKVGTMPKGASLYGFRVWANINGQVFNLYESSDQSTLEVIRKTSELPLNPNIPSNIYIGVCINGIGMPSDDMHPPARWPPTQKGLTFEGYWPKAATSIPLGSGTVHYIALEEGEEVVDEAEVPPHQQHPGLFTNETWTY